MNESKTPKQELIGLLNKMDNEVSFAEMELRVLDHFKEIKTGEKAPIVWPSLIGRKVFAVVSVFAVATIMITCNVFSDEDFVVEGQKFKFNSQAILDLIVYCMWVIIPPSWFLYEYTIRFPNRLKLEPVHFNDVKYTQELAGKIWGAVVVLISAILFLKYGKKL